MITTEPRSAPSFWKFKVTWHPYFEETCWKCRCVCVNCWTSQIYWFINCFKIVIYHVHYAEWDALLRYYLHMTFYIPPTAFAKYNINYNNYADTYSRIKFLLNLLRTSVQNLHIGRIILYQKCVCIWRCIFCLFWFFTRHSLEKSRSIQNVVWLANTLRFLLSRNEFFSYSWDAAEKNIGGCESCCRWSSRSWKKWWVH